jgi:hypothetical protein
VPSETDVAYCAGLIDGEGCIRVRRTKPYRHLTGRVNPAYGVAIQVRMVDEGAIRFLSETLGGWYWREKKPHSTKGRPLYCWQATDAIAETIIKIIRRYLRVKNAQADNALTLRALQANRRLHRTKPTGTRLLKHWTGKMVTVRSMAYSDEYIALCEAAYQRSAELNRVGV